MQSFKNIVASTTAAVSLLAVSSLPAAERVSNDPAPERQAKERVSRVIESPAEQQVGELIKESAQDNPQTHGFREPEALGDLYKIRYEGHEILPGESSKAVMLIQAKSKALGLSGKFDEATQKVVRNSLQLINSTLSPERQIEVGNLTLRLETIAPLIQHEQLLQKVAIVGELVSGRHRIIEHHEGNVSDETLQKMDKLIGELSGASKKNGKPQGSKALCEALENLRDGQDVLKPGDRSPAISYLKDKFGLSDNTDQYTKELHHIVIAAQILCNHGGRGLPIQNEGTIDARAMVMLLESSQDSFVGRSGVSSIDIIKASLQSNTQVQ